mmetsp:Transcript_118754/g.340904  ORF Transcript_118754/g.340904 Transcript_118754/m.340904 type:complete len:243 (-) Transcript_118754:35-763(-)|eukprot:CAMPEP_0170267218 /NCGR_PEP_ID=MMETSP0116_2-20130129/33532_1 /TAXON_ID=400756 /ORGANISM="Durinskia baltica, Strain CSIRO CS-38" /LENGTH=242 /DNA_ID=CAMNT_0010518367 /DNA_START=110 /DNA_END=838 /DNA_ORIENTATION=-
MSAVRVDLQHREFSGEAPRLPEALPAALRGIVRQEVWATLSRDTNGAVQQGVERAKRSIARQFWSPAVWCAVGVTVVVTALPAIIHVISSGALCDRAGACMGALIFETFIVLLVMLVVLSAYRILRARRAVRELPREVFDACRAICAQASAKQPGVVFQWKEEHARETDNRPEGPPLRGFPVTGTDSGPAAYVEVIVLPAPSAAAAAITLPVGATEAIPEASEEGEGTTLAGGSPLGDADLP